MINTKSYLSLVSIRKSHSFLVTFSIKCKVGKFQGVEIYFLYLCISTRFNLISNKTDFSIGDTLSSTQTTYKFGNKLIILFDTD